MTPIIHPSAMPGARRQVMLDDLAQGRLPAAFLYESRAQSERWLAVHETCSPVRNEPDCAGLYDWIAGETATRLGDAQVSVVSLGCGGGQKDYDFLERLNCLGYWPVDISETLTRESANNCSAQDGHPVVLDLTCAHDIGEFLGDHLPSGVPRVFILFGILPNINPELIGVQLRQLMKPGDWLALSVNLAPGADYEDGVRRVMAQYDNAPTRTWLEGALAKLGIPENSGKLSFSREKIPGGLRRIVACWRFGAAHSIDCSGVRFSFKRGETLEVFYSIRHTISNVLEWIHGNFLVSVEYRSSRSGEEAVFLCRSR